MDTRSDEIKARLERYNRVERVDDEYGRVIGVKLLKPSQRMRVEGMASDLQGNEDVETKDEQGRTVVMSIPRIAKLLWAASVREIDGSPIVFPKNREDLDLTVDTLDEVGMRAAAEGFIKLQMADRGDSLDVTEEAKNSAPAPNSDKPAG